jgi:hypothetical protein
MILSIVVWGSWSAHITLSLGRASSCMESRSEFLAHSIFDVSRLKTIDTYRSHHNLKKIRPGFLGVQPRPNYSL